jgi:hypothetical protein
MNEEEDQQKFWTIDDKFNIESKLLLEVSEPLCLLPNPIVSVVKSKATQNFIRKCADHNLKKNRLKKHSDFKLNFPFKISNICKHHFFKSEFSNIKDNFMVKKLKCFNLKVIIHFKDYPLKFYSYSI